MCCRMRRLNRPGERATLKTRTQIRILLSLVSVCLCPSFAHAQDNYEIQVYPSETVSRGVTMVELHNNFTAKGPKKTMTVLYRRIMPGTRRSKSPMALTIGSKRDSTYSP